VPLMTVQGIAFVPIVTSLKTLDPDDPDASEYNMGLMLPCFPPSF
jgi:hypothetical protein